MKQLLCSFSAIMLFGCSSGTSVNLGHPALTAAVNLPIAVSQAKSHSSNSCESKKGEAKKACIQQVKNLNASISKHIKNN